MTHTILNGLVLLSRVQKNARFSTKTFAFADFWNRFRGKVKYLIQSASTTVSKEYPKSVCESKKEKTPNLLIVVGDD